MKKIIFIIISALVLISCHKGTERNYRFINTVINYPDSLSHLMNNPNYTTLRVIYNSDYYKDKETILMIEKHIEKYFQNGFTILTDRILNHNKSTTINKKPVSKFLYEAHEIVLLSKLDSTKKLYFSFIDEFHVDDWKLDAIYDDDPYEEKEHPW